MEFKKEGDIKVSRDEDTLNILKSQNKSKGLFDNKISFNLSPSSLNMYYQSPLLFYLAYIAKVPDDTKVPACYSLSGNIVHDCLEKYAKKDLDRDGACLNLIEKWEKQNLSFYRDIKGNPLSQTEYLTAILNGMNIIDQHENHLCEETISFEFRENEIMKIGIKGVIDLQATEKEDNQPVIIDYKTSNSVSQKENFQRQALFYNLLIHKKKNIIPSKTSFHYLKLGVSKDYIFDLEQIEEFRQELNNVANKLLSFGTDIENYPIGEIGDIFNSKKQACLKEIARRKLFANTII